MDKQNTTTKRRFVIPIGEGGPNGRPLDVSKHERARGADDNILTSYAYRGGNFVFEKNEDSTFSLWVTARNILNMRTMLHAHTGTAEACLDKAQDLLHKNW